MPWPDRVAMRHVSSIPADLPSATAWISRRIPGRRSVVQAMKFCLSKCAETGFPSGEKLKPVKSDAAESSAEYALALAGTARDAAAVG